ncbi:MAG: DHH family phosphoesterase [Candidatus Thermoplasmatota archaeon]
MTDTLKKLCRRAAEQIHALPKNTKVRVISHYDADGVSAAGILCQMLYREELHFHATLMRNPFTKGFERLTKEKNKLIIFADMGSGQLDSIQKLNTPAIILDHHQPITDDTPDEILQINANLCGINGNYEASGATLSYGLASTVNHNNTDLAALALTGAIGDKQYIGGIRGYNATILSEALHHNVIQEYTGIKLSGQTILESLVDSIDPYYPTISGNQKNCEHLLEKLGVKPTTPVEELSEENMIKIHSFLLLLLIKNGCHPSIIDTVIRKRYRASVLGFELERFADLLDACGKNDQRGLALALCLGDKKLLAEAIVVEKDYKTKIVAGLQTIENGKFMEKQSIRYFYSESSSLGGVIAGIATNYLFDTKKPLFALTRKDDELHISCRGNQQLVAQGLDLGGALNQIARKLHGFGGGHKIAAGATIALSQEQEFLDQIDTIITAQLEKKT